jgi:hypothetical protein
LEVNGSQFTLVGREARCAGAVLWPPDARLSTGESQGRPQLRVEIDAPVVETVTVFCPRRTGQSLPRFECERVAPGSFRITCTTGSEESTLELSAATQGPLREPFPVASRVLGRRERPTP